MHFGYTRQLAEYLKLPQGPEHGPSEVLTTVLACMKRGWGGNKREKTVVSTLMDAVDLSDEQNALGICYQEWGMKEDFVRGKLNDAIITRQARWFKVGDICSINVSEQMDIVKELTGDVNVEWDADDPAILPMRIIKRRKESYAKWYRGGRNAVHATIIGMCRSLPTDILTCGRGWNC